MKNIIILVSLFLASCAPVAYIPESWSELKSVTYSCKEGFLMAQDSSGRHFCISKEWKKPEVKVKPKNKKDSSKEKKCFDKSCKGAE